MDEKETVVKCPVGQHNYVQAGERDTREKGVRIFCQKCGDVKELGK